MRFSDKFRGVRFTTVVQRIYLASKCILFAIQTEKPDSGDPLTLLNPGTAYHFGGGEVGIVIGTHDAANRLNDLMDEFQPDEWSSNEKPHAPGPEPADDRDEEMVPLDGSKRPKSAPRTPASPAIGRNPLSQSGATFMRVTRRRSRRGSLHKTELGLFLEVDNDGVNEDGDFGEDEESAEEQFQPEPDTPLESPRERPVSTTPPPLRLSAQILKSSTSSQSSSDLAASDLPNNVVETMDSPGMLKRASRSLSVGPRLTISDGKASKRAALISSQDSSTGHSLAESSDAVDSATPQPQQLIGSGGNTVPKGAMRNSTGSNPIRSSIRKSVQFGDAAPDATPNDDPAASSPAPTAAAKRLSLGDRLKLIKAQSTSAEGLSRSADRDRSSLTRRASMDVERVERTEAGGSADDDEDYAQTISTDQPFIHELASLRADLRKTDFKREKFVAPVTESISTVLFEEKPPKRSRTSDEERNGDRKVDHLSQNYYLLPAPRKTKDFVVTGKDCTLSWAVRPRARKLSCPPLRADMFTHSEEHILICGEASKRSFIHLITPMRSSKLGAARLRPIVFLHTKIPSPYELKIMSQYPEVYFVEGSMLSDFDLRRAGIKSAKHVVLLTTSESGSSDKPELVDSSVFFDCCLLSLQSNCSVCCSGGVRL